MSITQIRGSTQIMAGTITNAEIKSDAAIALSKLAEAVIQADGGQAFTADQPMGGFKITGLGTPSGGTDAANKAYVDSASAGRDWKDSVRVATTANITLSGTQTIDGVALSAGNRVLVKDQTDPAENGIYDVAAGAWSRSTDADSSAEVTGGMTVSTTEGTVNGDARFVLTTNDAVTLGTTSLTFTRDAGESVTGGDGLTKTGTVLSVNVDDSTIEINSDALRVKDAGITAAKLAAAVAGEGLTGGAGTALAVNVAGSGGLEIAADAVQINQDGTSLTVGAGGVKVNLAKFIVRETPAGTVNGANVTFTLANTPSTGKEQVFLNGLLQEPGGEDYTLTTNSIAFVTAPATGDRIRVTYIID